MSAYAEILHGRRHATPGGLYTALDDVGTFRDLSGNGNNEIGLAGSPVHGQDLLRVGLPTVVKPGPRTISAPLVGTKFDTGQAVEFPTATASFAAGQALTIACWVKRHAAPGGAEAFVGKSTNGSTIGGVFYLDSISGGRLIFHTYPSGGTTDGYCILQDPLGLGLGSFFHCGITFSTGTVARMYFNGIQRSFDYQQGPGYASNIALTNTVTNRNNSGFLKVGQTNTGYTPSATVHGLLVVQKELSPDEMRSLYLAGLAPDAPARSRGRMR